jgi:hypothetical protein
MGGVEELGTHLVVLLGSHLGGAGDGVGEGVVELAEEGGGLQDLGILVEAGDGRVVGALDRAALLLVGAGQIFDQIGGDFGVLGIFGDGELPAAERAGVLAVRSALGKGYLFSVVF